MKNKYTRNWTITDLSGNLFRFATVMAIAISASCFVNAQGFYSIPPASQVKLNKTAKVQSQTPNLSRQATIVQSPSKNSQPENAKTSTWCLSDMVTQNYISSQSQSDPDFSNKLNKMYGAIQQWINNNPGYLQQKALKTIPVVVHVVYNNAGENVSDALIYDMINTLNEDFQRLNADTSQTRATFLSVAADAQISFCLAQRDPSNNPSTGITRTSTTKTFFDPDTETDDMKKNSTGGKDAWDPFNYLNIWIADIDNGAGFGTAGYAYLPTPGMHGSWRDGLVLDNNIGLCFGCRTATHEIGHYLGLKHTWGNNPPSCTNDDGFTDTPTSASENFGCNTAQNTCNDGVGDKVDQIENYMSYADCQNMFSIQQANYMNSVLNTTRGSLLNSQACQPAAPPVADFNGIPNPVTVGSVVNFTDLSSGFPTSWSWTFGGGGTPNTSTSQNPSATFNTIGTYTITLIATNSMGSDTVVKTNYINVIAVPPCGIVGAIFCEDFESVTPPALPTGWGTTGNAGSDFFRTGVDTTASSTYFNIPTHTKFAYSNDDNCNCNKANDLLTFPTLNFTAKINVILSFNSYMSDDTTAAYRDSAYVQVSTNGGTTWTNVFAIPKIAAWTYNIVDLSAYDNLSNVMLRFRYADLANWGYGIAVDDIIVKENNDNDLSITAINKYDFIQAPEYFLVPNRQTGSIQPQALVENIGANNQNNVVLNVKIYDQNLQVIYDANSAAATINSFQQAVLSTTPYIFPKTATGTFAFEFTVASDSTDDDSYNNSWVDYYAITDTIYERLDTISPYYAISAGDFGGNAVPYRFGNYYEITRKDTATSISFVPWSTSTAGSQVRVVLYDSTLTTQVAQSNIYTLQTSDFENFITLPLTSTALLDSGKWYVASVNSLGTDSNAVRLLFGNQPAGGEAALLYTNIGAGLNWYTIGYIPWILLNTKPSVVVCNDSVNVSTTPASCGLCNGQATVTVTGINGPYTYLWNDSASQTTATATGLCPGSYQVLVSSQFCSYVNGGSVVDAGGLSISTSSTNENCGAGNGTATAIVTRTPQTITITVNNFIFTPSSVNAFVGDTISWVWIGGSHTTTSGTIPGGASSWDNPINSGSTNFKYAVTQSGTYNYFCTPHQGMGMTGTITVSSPTYTYTWNTSPVQTTATVTGLSSGTYNVTATNGSGCSVSTDFFSAAVVSNIIDTFSFSITILNGACIGDSSGSATVTPSGGNSPYSFLWSAAADSQTTATATGLVAGNYSVTATDIYGCADSITVTITQPATAVSIDSIIVTNAVCNGDTGYANAFASGGTGTISYAWSNGVNTANLAALAGTYSLTVTDNNGCADTALATINQPTVLVVSASGTNLTCNGICNGTLTASGTAGTSPYAYAWSGGLGSGATKSSVCAGTYTVTVTDANGCTKTANVTITSPLPLTATATFTAATCNGTCNGTLTAAGSGGTSGYTYAWSGGLGSGATKSSVCAGTYTVTVTDANGCTNTASATVTQPTVLVASASGTNLSCNGTCNGTLTASGSGGTTGYTYSWSGGLGSGATKTSVCAGTYTVTVTDANGCTDTSSATITEPTVLVASASGTNLTCNGTCNGTLTAIGTAGTSPYTYAWSGGLGSGATKSSVCAGTFTVTVTDANGCTKTATVTLSSPTALTATATFTAATCNGTCNGTLTAAGSGGTTGYTYSWSGGLGSGATKSGVCAGTYTVTVTDANGCTTTASATVSQPTAISASMSATAETTPGANNGTATATPSGGTGGFNYLWSNSGTTQTISGLAPGSYIVTISDANGCIHVDSTFVNAAGCTLVIDSTNQTNVSCFGGNNGTATVFASTGSGTYTYAWNNGQTTQTATGLNSASFGVTVTDVLVPGCKKSTTVIISQPATAVNNTVATTSPLCNGGMGSATASPSGGVSPYTFNWSTGGATSSEDSLVAGNYSVTVTDANACTIVKSFSMAEPVLLTVSVTATDETAFGANDGTASASPAGGTSAYTYLWNTGAQTQNIASLPAGNYCVTVTDANSCTATACDSVIAYVCTMTATATTSDSSACVSNDATAMSSSTGGTSPYTYKWSNSKTTQDISSLTNGTYSVTITDSKNCTAIDTVVVTDNNFSVVIDSVVVSSPVLCNGDCNGALTIFASGGLSPYTYFGDTVSALSTFSGLCAGTFLMEVTESGGGCWDTLSVTLTQPAVLISSSTSTDVLCNGDSSGTATVSATGGTTPYTYLWNTGAQTQNIASLPAGIYSVTVTDANGCSNADSVTVSQPASGLSVSLTSTNETAVGANDGSAMAMPSGGTTPYTYNWSNGGNTQSISNLAPGTYVVTVTDGNGCSIVDSDTIYVYVCNLSVSVSATDETTQGANDGTATATVSGGTSPFIFNWNNGGSTNPVTGLSPGLYSVTVTDSKGCTVQSNNVVVNAGGCTMTASASVTSQILCNGDSTGAATVTLTNGTAPFIFQWSNGDSTSTSSILSVGNYNVVVQDSNGCIASASVTLTEPSSISAVVTTTNPLCNGDSGSATVTASGGISPYSFTWSNGGTGSSQSNLSGGNYSFTITDANGCSEVVPFTINEPAALSVSVSSTDETSTGADDGTATATVSGGTSGYSYLWSNNGTSAMLSGLAPGTYSVTVTDANGCTITGSTIVNPFGCNLVLNSISVTDSINCNGGNDGKATVSVSGGTTPYSYTWSNGDATATADSLSAGSYSVTVTDNGGCGVVGTTTLSQPTLLTASVITTDETSVGADDGTASANVSGGTSPYTFLWNDVNSQTTPGITGLAPGTYCVTITDSNGCSDSACITVNAVVCNLSVAAMGTNETSFGANDGTAMAMESGGTSPFTYNWNNGENTSDIDSLAPGTYCVTLTDSKGCSDSTCVTVNAFICNLSVTVNATDETVAGANDGTATATVTGGATPYSYLWDGNSGGATVTGLAPGNHCVIVTDSSNCTATACDSVLPGAISVSEIIGNFQVSVFPNPVKDNLFINVSLNSPERISIEIRNYLGQIVQTLASEKTLVYKTIINTEKWSSGVYFISVQTTDGIKMERIVIE